MPRVMLPVLACGALLSLACSMGPKKPEYSEEIVGREVVHAGQTAAGVAAAGEAGEAAEPPGAQGAATDTPTGTGSAAAAPSAEVDCDATFPAPAQGAVTADLQCGGSITGTNEGGSSSFGDDFYQRAFCSPARQRYEDAPEAVYRLEVPANTQATVLLTSPCADLDLAAVSWTLEGLPTLAQVGRVRECEMATGTGGGKLTLTSVDRAQVFLLVVDGKQGEAGPFQLEAACGTYR